MNRIIDRLGHLHDRGIESSRDRFWMDEADVDCEADLPESSPPQPPVLQQDWQRALTQAAASLMQTVKDRLHREQRLEALIEQVRLLEKKVAAQSPRAFIIAPLTSLAPEPFEVVKEIKVVIEKYDEDEYLATFFDANINASGCNETMAFQACKETLVRRFNFLESQNPAKLGRPMKTQLAVLRDFIKRK